jgi:hypothetical protein
LSTSITYLRLYYHRHWLRWLRGIIGEIAQDTGKVGRLLAIWNVRKARDLAWDFADHLKRLTGLRRRVALAAQDSLTGVIGRGLLLHF